MKKLLLGISTALLLAACDDKNPPGQPEPEKVNVTIIGLNDFHGNLESSRFKDIQVDDPKNPGKTKALQAGGIEVLGGYLNAQRKLNRNLVFVGAGDLIGASPVTSSLLRDEPSVIALSKMGMKASSLGNHEFDQGYKELLRMQNGGCNHKESEKSCRFQNPYPKADFQWLGANVIDKTTRQPAFAPYYIEEVGGAKIGFIGAVLKETPTIVNPKGVEMLSFLDEAQSINKYVPELKKAKVDAIVVLIHQGGTTDEGFDKIACTNLEGPLVNIVKKLDPSIKAVISGHSHQGYNCLVDGRTVIQGDYYGHLLQRLDLVVDKANHKLLEVRAANVVMDTRTLPKDPEMTAILTKAKKLTDAVKKKEVATIGVDKISRSNNNAGESALGGLIADSQLAATKANGAQIAFMNPGGIRNDLLASAAGNKVTFGDVFSVQPFSNSLVVMNLTGAQLKALLEQQFQNPIPERDRIMQISEGFTYSYDKTAAKGNRVDATSMKLNGQVIDPQEDYRVAMNSFIAGGGDNFTVFKQGKNILQLPHLIDVEALIAYLKANPGQRGGPQDRIIRSK